MKKKLCTCFMIAVLVWLIHDVMLIIGCQAVYGNVTLENMLLLIRERLTMPGDAQRYLQIAGEGYQKEGADAINLVFYPLYPLLMRLLSFGVVDLAAVGMVLSRLCLAGAAVCLYELAKTEGGEQAGWYSVLLFAVYPFSVFTIGVYTESLFLLLSMGCMLAIRKEKTAAAGIIGFLAALTRVQGMLLLFPAVYHVIAGSLSKEKRKISWRDAFVLLIPMGFAVYLAINHSLHSNPFQFLIYEEGEPWYQSTRWIAENISTQYYNALNFKGLEKIIYWPQIILYFLAVAALFYGIKKEARMEYLLYGGVYVGFTYLSGWMISGGRYMMCCFPLYLVASRMKSEKVKGALLAGSCVFYFLYSLMFLQGYAIM